MKFKILLSDEKFIFQITDTYYLICNEYEYLKFRSKYFLNGAVAR